MKALWFIAGFLCCGAFLYDHNAIAIGPEMVWIHTEQDVCGYDDIGLIPLSISDIEGMLKN